MKKLSKTKNILLISSLSISSIYIASCNSSTVDLRSSVSSANLEATAKNAKTLTLSWDTPTDSNISSYTVYAGLETSTPAKIETVNVDLDKSFNRENPSITIPMEKLKDFKGAGTVCFTVTAANDEGESEQSKKVCEIF